MGELIVNKNLKTECSGFISFQRLEKLFKHTGELNPDERLVSLETRQDGFVINVCKKGQVKHG